MDWRIQALSEQREKPIISIVIPVYNVDMFLRKALQSVADQTFQNYEAIIVDDGSTDRCPEIIAKYVRKYSNLNLSARKTPVCPPRAIPDCGWPRVSSSLYGQRRLLSAHLSGGYV